MIPPLPATIFF